MCTYWYAICCSLNEQTAPSSFQADNNIYHPKRCHTSYYVLYYCSLISCFRSPSQRLDTFQTCATVSRTRTYIIDKPIPNTIISRLIITPAQCKKCSQYLLDIGLGWVGLDWVGLGWVGLGWVGLGWIGLGWVGLGWVGLVRIH